MSTTVTLPTADDPGKPLDRERRAAVITACVIGGVGAVGVAVPFVASRCVLQAEAIEVP
jgi:hypothetical protein